MLSIAFWVLTVLITMYLIMGALVVARNPRNVMNRTFLYFVVWMVIWIATNQVFQLVDDTTAYPVGLLSYGAAALIGVHVLRFALLLARKPLHNWLYAAGWLFAILSVVPGVLASGVKNHAIVTTPWILVYAAIFLAHLVAVTVILISYRHHVHGIERRRINTMLIGLATAFVGGSFFNLILPILGNYAFVQLGPVMSTPIVVAMVLAIIRHHLFDIRFALARSATYVLLFLSLFVLYAGAAFSAIQLLFPNQQQPTPAQNAVYLVLAVLLVFTYSPLKRFFDRITDKIFFQHGYDAAQIVDALGDIAAREIELNRVSNKSLAVLGQALKPDAASIYITSKGQHVTASTFHVGNPQTENWRHLIAELRHIDERLVVRDELEKPQAKLDKAMVQAHTAVSVKLRTSREAVGYLLLGPKQNGSIYNTRDLRLLATAADELSVAIQNALRFEEISRFNVTLREEIHDATKQLRESNKKLHKLDEAKDEFIGMASHQLRTPLTSVKGYLSMVLEGDVGNISGEQRKLLQEAYGSAQRMVYLIGDFLNVSRLQTGKFVLEISQVNLARMVSEEVEQLHATAERRGIRLEYHEPTNFPDAQMDDGKMRQVVMNFIDNAIFYSRPNSAVMIELTANDTDTTLAVHDNGIGVPPEERHHLFTKFYRASNARRVRPDGTGIGLYMAKKVITAHGGHVIFETKENKGSTFGFKIPLKHKVDELVHGIHDN